jgi:hypothetical protein
VIARKPEGAESENDLNNFCFQYSILLILTILNRLLGDAALEQLQIYIEIFLLSSIVDAQSST